MLPVSELKNMQQALIEEGTDADMEAVELLEGIDYNIDDEGEGIVDEQQIQAQRIE